MLSRTAVPELPSLAPGVTLLESEEHATGALHSLVLDHVLLEGGSAVWVDARGHGTTVPMARLAPTMRVLDRVNIARAFTPWQHQGLLRALAAEVSADTSLVVLPAVDAPYRTDDLGRGERDRLLAEGRSLIAELAAEATVPVLLTRQKADRLARPLEAAADERIECTLTQFGPRFSGEEFETLVYPVEDGTMQTTLSFWRRVLVDRHPALADGTTQREVTARGAN